MSDVQQSPPVPTSNGHRDLSTDETIISAIEVQKRALDARRDELEAELGTILPELRKYERAIAVMRGEKLSAGGRTVTPPADGDAPAPKVTRGTKSNPVRASEESIARNEAAIRQLTADSDDFTQVQVRAITGESSGASSLAFKALRERGIVRLARQDGNAKIFRLTRAALNQQTTLDEDAEA